jgi:hypothetical protein
MNGRKNGKKKQRIRVLIDTPNNSEKVMPFNSESDSLGISGFAAPGGYRFRETAP